MMRSSHYLRVIGLTCLIVTFGVVCAWSKGSPDDFKKYNPDVVKYEFGRSYISALSYFDKIDRRLDRINEKFKDSDDEHGRVTARIQALFDDNGDLLIAKNYLIKYLRVPNALMRKVADNIILICEEQIRLNTREGAVWERLNAYKDLKNAPQDKKMAFYKKLEELAVERKETMRKLIETTVLTSKVLMSEEAGHKNESHRLAITGAQRDKLDKKLDSFAKDYYDWGIKPGQTTIQACVATIREILEDPAWESSDNP